MIVLTDAQWFCIRPFLYAYSGIYVVNETHYLFLMAALCWMARSGAPWRRQQQRRHGSRSHPKPPADALAAVNRTASGREPARGSVLRRAAAR